MLIVSQFLYLLFCRDSDDVSRRDVYLVSCLLLLFELVGGTTVLVLLHGQVILLLCFGRLFLPFLYKIKSCFTTTVLETQTDFWEIVFFSRENFVSFYGSIQYVFFYHLQIFFSVM